jgi:hypothetical protein
MGKDNQLQNKMSHDGFKDSMKEFLTEDSLSYKLIIKKA